MKTHDFWTPIMVILGIVIVVILLIIFNNSESFTQVDWSSITPEIIEFAPWIAALGIAFGVFLYLKGGK